MPKVGIGTIQSLTVALAREHFSSAQRIATWVFNVLMPRLTGGIKSVCILKESVEAELAITFRHGEYSRLMKFLIKKRILIQEFTLQGWSPYFTHGPGFRMIERPDVVPSQRTRLLAQLAHHQALLSAACSKLGLPDNSPEYPELQAYLIPPT